MPLAEGWVATPTEAGLAIGPKGKTVATLELKSQALPRAHELATAATAEGATDVTLDEGQGYAAARYVLGEGRGGFLAVKQVAGRTVWCASTADASAHELDDGLAACRNLSNEAQ